MADRILLLSIQILIQQDFSCRLVDQKESGLRLYSDTLDPSQSYLILLRHPSRLPRYWLPLMPLVDLFLLHPTEKQSSCRCRRRPDLWSTKLNRGSLPWVLETSGSPLSRRPCRRRVELANSQGGCSRCWQLSWLRPFGIDLQN